MQKQGRIPSCAFSPGKDTSFVIAAAAAAVCRYSSCCRRRVALVAVVVVLLMLLLLVFVCLHPEAAIISVIMLTVATIADRTGACIGEYVWAY